MDFIRLSNLSNENIFLLYMKKYIIKDENEKQTLQNIMKKTCKVIYFCLDKANRN
jgi:hypothetical protein